jgi:hemerythrin superfamily protein
MRDARRFDMPNRTDAAIAKTKGAAHRVRARMDGLHGVFATLAKQHAEVTALMKRVEDDSERREDLWPKIRTELLSHEKAELRVIYPELRMNAGTRGYADQHEEDAQELELLIGELDDEPIDSLQWGAKFELLAATVREHAKFEEKQIFPEAEKALGKLRTKALDDEFTASKEQIAGVV